MKRGSTAFSRGFGGIIIAGGVCVALFGIVGVVQANAPKAKAQKPVTAGIGWGEPQDGLQIGLFPQSYQKSYRYGDTIALVFRARNVSAARIELSIKQQQITSVTLGEAGRLVLQTLGGSGTTVPFRLAPGEIAELPGGRFTAQITAPGEKPEPTENAPAALPLLPGMYRVECNYPIWMPDKEDPNRSTAHRARAGGFAFTVRNDVLRQPQIRTDQKASDTSIVWGETINGLQGGLRRVTDRDLAALPADKRNEIAPNEILTQFYVRNKTNKSLHLAYHNFDGNDASLWVKDAQGKDHQVHTVWFTGLRAMSEQTLQPGEMMKAGEGHLKFQMQEVPREENTYTPILTAEPGQYSVRLISSVRFSGLNNFDMVLVSGAIPFAVTPQ